MNWSETCKCLSQPSFRDFVVATVSTPGTNRCSSRVFMSQMGFVVPFASQASAAGGYLPTFEVDVSGVSCDFCGERGR